MTRSSLRPGPRNGLEIAEARGWRIDATSGGGVVLHEPGRPERIVAAPGEVDRVVVLRDQQVPKRLDYFGSFNEVLVLMSDDAPLLIVPLHLLAHGRVSDASQLRHVSGAADFAQALGLSLEPATHAEAELAAHADAAVVQLGPVRASLRAVFWRHCVLLGVAVLAALGTGVLAANGALVSGFVAVVALGVLAVDQWRFRSRFLDLVEHRPASPDRVELPNILDGTRDHSAREASLQIGADDVVHRVGATEAWIAGPRLGGAVKCVWSDNDQTVRFLDRHDTELLVVDAEAWIPAGDDSALQGACRRAGIEYGHSARTFGEGGPGVPLLSQAELGDFVIVGPLATTVIAFALFIVHIAPFDDLDVPRAVIAVVAAAAATLSGVAQLRQWRWNRHQTSLGGRS